MEEQIMRMRTISGCNYVEFYAPDGCLEIGLLLVERGTQWNLVDQLVKNGPNCFPLPLYLEIL